MHISTINYSIYALPAVVLSTLQGNMPYVMQLVAELGQGVTSTSEEFEVITGSGSGSSSKYQDVSVRYTARAAWNCDFQKYFQEI